MRIAIFGGTFDPIHCAHLTVAREALAECALDRVLFVPAANPPHKAGGTTASYEERLRMVEVACAGEPQFVASDIEAGSGKSYSIHTVERLKTRYPDDEWLFLIGADAFADLSTWYRWSDLVAAVEFIVVTRPGHEYATPEGARIHRLDTLALPVSSSEVRQRLTRGESPEELPEPVLRFIRERGLYQAPVAPGA